MKTSYYNFISRKKLDGLICISRSQPNWLPEYPKCEELMPSWNLLNDFHQEKIDEGEYIERYKKQLSRLSAEEVYKKLMELSGGAEPILLCWCGKDDFCHRHIAADWFEKELGIKVSELGSVSLIRENGRVFENKTLELF